MKGTDNPTFCEVSKALMDDFAEGGKFYYQGVAAEWGASTDIFSGEKSKIMRVKREVDDGTSVVVAPSVCAGVKGVQLLVKKGDGGYAVGLYPDEMSRHRMIEIARFSCVAAFGVEDRS